MKIMKATVLAILVISPLLGQKAKPVVVQNAPPPAGRFQLIQLSDMRQDQFLLDTQTGRLWQLSADSKTGNRVLVEITSFLSDMTPAPVLHPASEPPPKK